MGESTGKLNNMRGSLILMNTMFGAGVLNIPSGFLAMGTLGGTLFLAGCCSITLISLIFLCIAGEESQIFDYSKMCKKMGRFYSMLLDTSIVLLCYGCTLVYFLILLNTIIKSLPQSLAKKLLLTDEGKTFRDYICRAVVGLVIGVPLFFLAKMKSLDKLSFTAIMTVCATFFVGAALLMWNTTVQNEPTKIFQSNVLSGYPTLFFALGCQQNGIAIYSNLKKRKLFNGIVTMGLGCFLGFVIYALIGIFGYKTFGSAIEKDSFFKIISNDQSSFITKLKTSSWDKYAVCPKLLVLAFIIVLVGGFPLQTFAGRSSLSNLFFEGSLSDNKITIITGIQLVLYYIFGILDVSADTLVTYIGASICPIISFTIPSLLYIHYVKKRGVGFITAIFLIILSLVSIVIGLGIQIKKSMK